MRGQKPGETAEVTNLSWHPGTCLPSRRRGAGTHCTAGTRVRGEMGLGDEPRDDKADEHELRGGREADLTRRRSPSGEWRD